MDGVVRELIRKERSRLAHLRVRRSHVEYCIECGKAVDRTGSNVVGRCFACSKKGVKCP